jgi:hypothetical protein
VEATPERESELIERARHGDVAAFEALVRAHQEICFRTAWREASHSHESRLSVSRSIFAVAGWLAQVGTTAG